MSTRSLICDSLRTANTKLDRFQAGSGVIVGNIDDSMPPAANYDITGEAHADAGGDVAGDDDDESTMDIDITDISSEEDDGKDDSRRDSLKNMYHKLVRSDVSATEMTVSKSLRPKSPLTNSNNSGSNEGIGSNEMDIGDLVSNSMASSAGCQTVLTKAVGRENRRLTTKNWLISDSPKRSNSDGEFSNSVIYQFQ